MNASKLFVTALSAVSLATVMSISYAQSNSNTTTPAASTSQQVQQSTTPAEVIDPTMPNSGKAGIVQTPAIKSDTAMQTERVARADRN